MVQALTEDRMHMELPDNETMVRRHYDSVWKFCWRRVGERFASDSTQETFILACRKRKQFRGESSPETWLFGIAHNVCRNVARRRKLETAKEWIGNEPSVESPATGALDRLELRKALGQLSEEHREAVLMHEVEGLTYAEIGNVLGVPEGTVKSRLHHAFAHLRKQLSAEWEANR